MSRKNPGTGSYKNSKTVGLRYGNTFESGRGMKLCIDLTEKNKLSMAGNCVYLERVL